MQTLGQKPAQRVPQRWTVVACALAASAALVGVGVAHFRTTEPPAAEGQDAILDVADRVDDMISNGPRCGLGLVGRVAG